MPSVPAEALAQALRQLGHDVTFWTDPTAPPPATSTAYDRCVQLEGFDTPNRAWTSCRLYWTPGVPGIEVTHHLARTPDAADAARVLVMLDGPTGADGLRQPGQVPWVCDRGGAGQRAFAEGLVPLGFAEIPAEAVPGRLAAGERVLVHGWHPEWDTWSRQWPGQLVVLWHSGWTVVDLLNESGALLGALRAADEGRVQLLWLDARDLPPRFTDVCIAPVWDPQQLRARAQRMRQSRDPGSVVVGLHSATVCAPKNVVTAIAGVAAAMPQRMHIGEAVLADGERGALLARLVKPVAITRHGALSRDQFVGVLTAADLLVHPSLADSFPMAAVDSIYARTAVVTTDALSWTRALPAWARKLCVVRPASATAQLADRVRELLGDDDARRQLVEEQVRVLDGLLPDNQQRTTRVLTDLGFAVRLPATTSAAAIPDITTRTAGRKAQRPRVLLLSDVRGWAFDVNLRDMAEYLSDRFDFSYWYVIDEQPLPPASTYDAVYVPYHRWNVVVNGDVPRGRGLGSLRSWWFTAEQPGPPGDADVALVNSFRGFHVVTQHNYNEIATRCPQLRYLTNPVNMRRVGTATQVRGTIVASWNGNARHSHAGGADVKGFWSIVEPACVQAGVPLVYAEYNTRRVAPEAMPAFYRQGNVAICASLYEGASNSIMEAMAAGQALISTDVGNVREMQESQLRHLGATGIIIVPRSATAIVEALTELRRTPARITEMGRCNRREIRERWSWTVWADRYASFLREAL